MQNILQCIPNHKLFQDDDDVDDGVKVVVVVVVMGRAYWDWSAFEAISWVLNSTNSNRNSFDEISLLEFKTFMAIQSTVSICFNFEDDKYNYGKLQTRKRKLFRICN